MRAIMVMYDSLRRDMLPAYCAKEAMELPNFRRLSRHTVTFDKSYVGSLPCMPARRELHTGRANFLHRGWGPVEPFDVSMPELLKTAGIHTHLATDHYHYIQDGGATYHGRYATWECYRGQESDAWIGDCTLHGDEMPPQVMCNSQTFPFMRKTRKKVGWQNMANRNARMSDADYPQVQTVDNGIDFMKRNAGCDRWFLQIETFDPHEPFDSPKCYQDRWFDPDEDYSMDWPTYSKVSEEDDVASMRKKYKALMEFCDWNLGRILDIMDELDMWKDTLLIVNTDHGFCLGEHRWWGKGLMPDYEELTHTPLFIWDPLSGRQGEHCGALVQTIDLAPTLLEYFGQDIPAAMLGVSLLDVLRKEAPAHKYALFGFHGGPINITDGRYVYMRAARMKNAQLYEYTLMPTHMNSRFKPEELEHAQLTEGFSFNRPCPVLKVPVTSYYGYKLQQDLLFDLEADPHQEHPIVDACVEERMLAALVYEMQKNEAPEELYDYYALKKES